MLADTPPPPLWQGAPTSYYNPCDSPVWEYGGKRAHRESLLCRLGIRYLAILALYIGRMCKQLWVLQQQMCAWLTAQQAAGHGFLQTRLLLCLGAGSMAICLMMVLVWMGQLRMLLLLSSPWL